MPSSRQPLIFAAGLALLFGPPGQPKRFAIESPAGLDPVNVSVSAVDYRGRKAVRVVGAPAGSRAGGEAIAIVRGAELSQGTITVDLAGVPGPDAAPDDRGFIGIAFHIQSEEERLQTFYLRPTNGRAEDQLRRNHAVQYTAEPDWPWHRLRKEEPGKYEAYADMVAGQWTAIKIVLAGSRAELYLNGSPQPTLIVTDLKTTAADGKIALWIGNGTVGHFANLRVTPGPS